MERQKSNLFFSFAGLATMAVVFCLSREQTSQAAASREQTPQAGSSSRQNEPADPNQPVVWNRPRSRERENERTQMVNRIRWGYGLDEPSILEAMQNVPRFVPPDQQGRAYLDSPLPIGYDQTISQPFIVAYMTQMLDLDPNDRVLEIGTGSGYQAAVLNEFTPHVFTIEIVKPLGERAIETFKKHGYETIRVKIGDGYKGWPEAAPFDAIIVTCAPDDIPAPLLEQLRPGGKMIIPVGSRWEGQELVLVEKDEKGKVTRRSVMPVRFVPLVREKD
jgi:protein-L-isoaspartate(D-aspartate) O-methyltransferase